MRVSQLAIAIGIGLLVGLRFTVATLLQGEITALCNWLGSWLMRAAVRRLPKDAQARWEEEWSSHLEDQPTPLSRLGWGAAIFFYAAPRQARLLEERTPTARGVVRIRPGSFALGLMLTAMVAAVYAAWMYFGFGGETATTLFSNLVQALVPLVAAWACFRAARRNPYGFGRAWTAALHRAWRRLGLAALAWGLGQIAWAIQELRTGQEPGVPSLADVGFLVALPFLIAGVLAFPTAPIRATARLRTLLDGLLIAASLLLLGWAAVLGDAFRANGTFSPLERTFMVAYPLGDIVAGTIVLVLLTRSRGRGVVHLSMIAAAVFSLLVADLGFAYQAPIGGDGSGSLVDLGWVVGWLLLAAAALKPTVAELRRSDDEEEPSITRLALPYAPLVVSAVTALILQIFTGEFEPFLVYTGTMIGLLVISRQIVALIEHRQLNDRLRATVIELSEREWELREELRRTMNAAENAHRQPAAP
jgi:hypothetical protein